jgi:LuxR family maltose regulon positive regulatory protein
VWLGSGKSEYALHLLPRIIERARQGRRRRHLIKLLILQFLASWKQEDQKQTLDAASEAVQLAEPEGFVRIFVEEGKPVSEVFKKLKANRKIQSIDLDRM